MSEDNASLLIGAGAATVLLYPLAAVLVLGRTDGRPRRCPEGGRRGGRLVLTRPGGQPVVAYVSAARLSNS